ncbi:hypothetical protein DBR47_19405 [Paucibacter sp. KBW04]|uniref:hypothetical protein n=1 Tax=Paucibacter sp. KBW04 TaxID=2153361 RepID=UPI000F55E1EA|nr:hypothetical protein [Paucibacter sp. KBW04]RQO56027.1 hypothetical protein DBR47_19405 [Paucibacter sp. KBW04]
MSEFSESYQLRAEGSEAGIELLRRANLRGFVFPAKNGWVTVLPEGEPFVPNEQLVAANTGTLLYFASAEDHGWWCTLYENNAPIASYVCTWEEAIQVHQALDIVSFENALGPIFSTLGEAETRKIFNPNEIEEVLEQAPSSAFAEAVGLTNYQWLSFQYLLQDMERGEQNFFEGVVFVE